ncbi:MAG: pyruvate ferredoxin oxidoreductase, partial [Candidatus Heimdallarchaeota archaeon]|nr:pyruvate ferredoxin oxidoreductase [Candidatus Heimdallarchaeota archaeon]
EEMAEVLKDVKAVGVFDRSFSYGSTGQVFLEVRNALYELKKPILNFIAGLGGRDIRCVDLQFMFDKLKEVEGKDKIEDPLVFVNTRGVTV